METSPENDQRFFAPLRMTLQDGLISLAIQRHFENVADAANRVDQLRLERVVHFRAQPAYNHIDDVRVGRESDVPNVFCNFVARHHRASLSEPDERAEGIPLA